MTRVHGRLFGDGRDGVLVVKPSKPFFGADKYERHYPVTGGSIDIELTPTPRGVFYNVGFKEDGDLRDTPYTLQWRIPSTDEIDITPGAQEAKPATTSNKSSHTEISNRRLTSELAEALQRNEELQDRIDRLSERNDQLNQRVSDIERSTEVALRIRDRELEELREATAPQEKTVFLRVPVLPGPLQERITRLEAENQRLAALNDTYYQAVLELNQLKLDRAQTVHLPQTVEEIPDNPRARLIQKLRAN
jgi:hypothetical protein